MSNNNINDLIPGAKPGLLDPPNSQGPATEPSVDTEMDGSFESESAMETPQQDAQGILPTQPEENAAVEFGASMPAFGAGTPIFGSGSAMATTQQDAQEMPATQPEKKGAVIFGAGMDGTVSANGNNSLQSSKIFGIAFNGGKRIDEDTLKFQLVAVNTDLETHKQKSKERCDKLEAEIVDLKNENHELEKQKMEKTKQINVLLSQEGSSTDSTSQDTLKSDSTIKRLTAEKKVLTTLNRRMAQDNENLKEKINGLESEDQVKERKLQSLEDLLEAERMCRKTDMEELQDEYDELSKAFDDREDDCKKLDVQVDELTEERDLLRQELQDVSAQANSGVDIEAIIKERDDVKQDLEFVGMANEHLIGEIAQLRKDLDKAKATSSQAVQSVVSERDELRQQLDNITKQLNDSVQKESEMKAKYDSVMTEIERIKPEFENTTQRAATVDGLEQKIQSLQTELNGVNHALHQANAERSQAIADREQTIKSAHQAAVEFNSSHTAELIQQLRKSIENLESEKAFHQDTIIKLEGDITKINDDYNVNLSSFQQNHQYIVKENNEAIEELQNRLVSVESQHQNMVKEKDEMIQRLKAEASTGEVSLRKSVLEAQNISDAFELEKNRLRRELGVAKKSADAAELEKNRLRRELGIAKNSVLEVQSSNKLIRNDLTKLHTEIESMKTVIAKTDEKAKLAERQLAETAELLVKEQTAHAESKKKLSTNSTSLKEQVMSMSKSSRLELLCIGIDPPSPPSNGKSTTSKAADKEEDFELEEELVTPVQPRTLVRDAPSASSLLEPDESDIALGRETIRSGLESVRAETKAEFMEEIKTELRKELVESVKVELREHYGESVKVELREELAERVKAEIEEALLTSSAISGQEVQTSQASVMAFEGQENNLNLAGIVTSDSATSTFVHETAELDASAVNGSLIDGQTPIPVIVHKGKSLPRLKAYTWSMAVFIFLLASLLVGIYKNPVISSTPGVVQLIHAPRPAIIPIATMNAPLFATRTTFQLAVIPATASASVQSPQVTTIAVPSSYDDYFAPILHRTGIIYQYRIVVKVKSVFTWDALYTFEDVVRYFSDKH